MKSMEFIFDLFKKFPGLMTKNIVLVVAVGLLGAGSLFTVTPVVDFFIHQDLQSASPLTIKVVEAMESVGLPVTLTSLLVMIVTFITLASVFQVFTRYSLLQTKYVLSKDIMIGTFKDFFDARWSFFSASKQGTLINTLTRELSVVGTAFGGIGLLFARMLHLLFFIAIPLYISWKVTVSSLGIGLLFAVPFGLLSKTNYRLGLLNTSTANQLTSFMQENFNLAKIVLGFGTQARGIQHLSEVYDVHIRATLRSQILSVSIPIFYRPLGVIMVAIAVLLARREQLPLSEMMVLILALVQAAQSIGNVVMYRSALDNFLPSHEQIEKLRSQAREMKHVIEEKKFPGFSTAIAIKGLSFAYPKHAPVLKNINAIVPKGKMIAFVGKSGAGKSTLIDLIMGFYEPAQGQIFFDDTPLEDYDIISYRRRVGYVPQDSVLFNMTIRENLLWANPDASDERIKEACRLAYPHEFIVQIPVGYA